MQIIKVLEQRDLFNRLHMEVTMTKIQAKFLEKILQLRKGLKVNVSYFVLLNNSALSVLSNLK